MTISARTRQIVYALATLAGLIGTWALAKGWIDTADAAFLTGAVSLVTGLATAKTGDPAPPVAAEDVQAGDVVEVIPAPEATSDTKADAVGESTSRRALKAKQTDGWEE